MTRAFDELGMIGVGVATKMGGKSLADPSFDPVYEELNRRGGVLFVIRSDIRAIHRCSRRPAHLAAGAPFEDTAAALQLLQNGFVKRFPKIRRSCRISRHVTVSRAPSRSSTGRFMNGHGVPSQLVKKFWYDSVNVTRGTALFVRYVRRRPHRVRTDYPFWSGAAHQHASSTSMAGLSTADV